MLSLVHTSILFKINSHSLNCDFYNNKEFTKGNVYYNCDKCNQKKTLKFAGHVPPRFSNGLFYT